MPVRRVQGPNGRVGYQWGETGKIYTGPDAMQKAQGPCQIFLQDDCIQIEPL